MDHYLFLISFLEKPARADDRLEREDLRLKSADLRLGRADLKRKQADLRPYRPNNRPGRPDEGDKWIDKQTNKLTNESPPVFFRTLSPSEPLPGNLKLALQHKISFFKPYQSFQAWLLS